LKIEGDGKQMMMMDRFWSHKNGFSENVFRGIARLGAERPACELENLFYKKK
jgi:hypothetical protein